jgi:integrase/recombinase XerC
VFDLVTQRRPRGGAEFRRSSLTHLGEQGASLLMLMAKSRHKKPENVRR